jgi:hypothetical protein
MRMGGGVEEGRRIERDWQAWRAEYGEAWDAGVADTSPPPPYAEHSRYAV